MKDIDFDELDRAVSSLMGSVPPEKKQPIPKQQASTVSAEEQLASTTPAQPVPDVVSDTVPITVTRPKPQATPKAAPAQRRSGRFMDMVSKSSERPATVTQPSRTGMAITPRTSQAPSATVNQNNEPTVEQAPQARPDAEAPSSASVAQTTSAEPKPEPATPIEQPFESPFLTGTKVDKRPLNAAKSDSQAPVEKVESDSSEQNDIGASANDIPVREELNEELVAIEADDTASHEPTEEEVQPDPSVDRPLGDPAGESSGPPSIAQQYREQPSSGDKDHAAIYDTSQYAEPLTHPAKRKSGWLWVLWVIILLALGAGGAIALYMTNLI